MATQSLPDPPAKLRAIQTYMKIAQDVERVDPVVSYWLRLFSTESALKIDRDSPECKSFLSALILWLEKFKSTHKDNEAVTNQTVGQAHYENFVLNLFNKADTQDRESAADKVTVRMFFMATILFEAMAVFGPLTEDISQKAKYAKFKAAYIQKCFKTGQTPKPGPVEGSDLEGKEEDEGGKKETTNERARKDLDIPEVPSDTNRNDSQPKLQGPFILNPSSPPSSLRPSLPPSLPPGSPYSMNTPTPSKTQHETPTNSNVLSDTSSTTKDSNRSTINETRFFATNGAPLDPQDIIQGQKYCKFANSALQYDDIPTAVDNLQKALKLLTTGEKPS